MKKRIKLVGLAFLLCTAALLGIHVTDLNAAGRSTGELTVSGGNYGDDYRYDSNTLMILSEMPVTISGKTKKDRIQVKSGVDANLTLKDLDIRVNGCALDAGTGNSTIKFRGDNYLKSGAKCAGILVAEDTTVTISGGKKDTLSVYGGSQAAGIGSEKDGAFGEITISSGTVSATGGVRAAGIGNGYQGAGGTLRIKGGRVIVKGGAGAAGMGRPQEDGNGHGSIELDGSCLVYADTVLDEIETKQGMLFAKERVDVYGRVVVSYPFEVTAGQTMLIPADGSIQISNDLECINRGEIYVYGSLDMGGTLQNDGQLYDYSGMLEDSRKITGNSVTVRDIHDIYLFNGNVVFTENGYEQNGMEFQTDGGDVIYTIYGEGKESQAEIEVADGISVSCTLEGVKLVPEKNGYALTVGEGSQMHLLLSGENEFTGAGNALSGCILIKKDGLLEVEGDGTLTLIGKNGDRVMLHGNGASAETNEDLPDLDLGEGDYSIPVKEDRRSMEAALDRELLETLVEERRSADIDGNLLRIHFNWRALEEILDGTKGDITLRISPFTLTDSFSNAKLFIGSRAVYDIQIVNGDGKVVSIPFRNGEATLAIPYTKPADEDIRKLYLVYVGANNTLDWIADSRYDEQTEEIISEVHHFSVYGIGYQIPVAAVSANTAS